MAKKKSELTDIQKEYNKEYNRLKNRVKTWEKKHRILYTKMPEKLRYPNTKSIERIKRITYNSFTEKQIKKYRAAYDEAYEEGLIPDPYKDRQPYTPNTENMYYDGLDTTVEEEWEDTYTEPVKSREEIEAFIEETIDNILDVSGIDRPNEAIRDIFDNLLNSLRRSLGDTGFYEYLSDPATVEELTQAAQTGMAISPTKDSSGAEKQGAQDAISKFTYALNRHRPLDIYQTKQLEEVIQSNGLESGVIFEDID